MKKTNSEIDDNTSIYRVYAHEQEVRAVLELTRRDERTEEEYKAHPMAGLDDPAKAPKPDFCPSNIYVPIPEDFFDEIEVDGRVEEWQFEAMKLMFEKFELKLNKNDAFSDTNLKFDINI